MRRYLIVAHRTLCGKHLIDELDSIFVIVQPHHLTGTSDHPLLARPEHAQRVQSPAPASTIAQLASARATLCRPSCRA